jgi:hypothetical protein
MTLKSRFTGGAYEDIPMNILLDMGKKSYIVVKYYQYDTINFNKEMLELLQITPELQIPKPGHNMKMYDKWKEVNSLDHLTDLERIKLLSGQRSARIRKAKNVERHSSRKSKGFHMNKNRTRPN